MEAKKNKNKKGEMTSKTIIEVVLVIAGLVAILYVYSQFAGGNTVDRTVCSQSVVYRGTLFDKSGLTTKEIVPLKCKTRLVCISDKTKGECGDELTGKYETIKIDSSADKIDNQIKMTLAREMADCWNMMGEGKVQIFSRNYFLDSSKGVICSQIAFDKSVKEKVKDGKINGFTYYLVSHQIPGKEVSYWEYLTRGDYSDSNNLYIAKNSNLADVDSLTLNKKAILFVELDQSYIGGLLGAAPIGIMGAATGAKIGAVVGSFVPFVGTGVGFVVGGAIGGAASAYVGGQTGGILQDYAQSQFKGGNFISGQFLIDYSPEAIKSFNVDSLENNV